MEYSLKEILSNTSSYLFYKRGDEIWEKKYRPSILSKDIKADCNIIFIPFFAIVNNVAMQTFCEIEHCIKKGVRAFFFDEERFAQKNFREMLFKILEKYEKNIDFVIMTQNSLGAMYSLAQYTRFKKFSKDLKVICVTGSIGKTSTTEMVYSIFKQKHKIFRGEPMVNLRLRINHKLLEAPKDCEYLLFECSGAVKGYLKKFSELLAPDGIILTRVSSENLGKYGSLQNIAEEKCSLMTCAQNKSVAILNDCEEIRRAAKDYDCKKIFTKEGDYTLIKSDNMGSKFIYKGEKYVLRVAGEHQINNAIKAIELAKSFNIDERLIKKGLFEFRQVGNRWLVDKIKDAIIVTDAPNNPSFETIVSCINTFLNIYKDYPQKRILISGIRELGRLEKEIHLKLAKFIEKQDIDELICVEKEAKTVYEYIKSNAAHIKTLYFDKPSDIDENTDFVRYIIDTINQKQALLIKGQGIDPVVTYEKVAAVLKRIFKNQ